MLYKHNKKNPHFSDFDTGSGHLFIHLVPCALYQAGLIPGDTGNLDPQG